MDILIKHCASNLQFIFFFFDRVIGWCVVGSTEFIV
jgi:hypothetical protein